LLTAQLERLVDEITQHIFRFSQFKKALGQSGDSTDAGVLLSIGIPGLMPRKYGQWGVLIKDDEKEGFSIAYHMRTMSQEQYLRYRNTLFPAPAFWGVYDANKAYFTQEWKRMKQALNSASKAQITDDGKMAGQAAGNQHAKRESEGQGGRMKSSDDVPKTGQATERVSIAATPAQVSGQPDSQRSLLFRVLQWIKLPERWRTRKGASPEVVAFYRTFFRNYRKGEHFEVPPGHIEVRGAIEVVGTKAVGLFHVAAAYDVKQGQFKMDGAAIKLLTVSSPNRKKGT
jgi:hypothetical protein